MFRLTFVVAVLLATTSAFSPSFGVHDVRATSLFAETKADIPEAISQGPQEGQIPAADNNKKGEKTMESLANQGKNKEGEKKED